MSYFGPDEDDLRPFATQSEAHAEWHRNSGNPIGRTTCPWDACDPGEYYEALEAEEAYRASIPALREGEEPAHYNALWPIGPEVKWWAGSDEPPF